MTYYLKTTYPCLVKAKEAAFELDPTDMLEIVDEEFLCVYPMDDIPFYVNLLTPRESERVSFVTHDEKSFIILESVQKAVRASKKVLNFSGKTCTVTAGEDLLVFESNSAKVELKMRTKGALVDIFSLKDFACVQFEEDFYAFSTKNGAISHISGKTTRVGDKLSVLRKFSDSQARERQATFKIGESIEVESESFCTNRTGENEELVALQMLESVQARDFGSALSMLSEGLRDKMNEKKLSAFFGNVSQVLPLTKDSFITISQSGKNFVTVMAENGKICDISIDKLT